MPPERDPVAIQALNDQILTDPDLSIRNEANAALTTSTDHSIPPIVATREAIANAREEATELLGGTTSFEPLPDEIETTGALPAAANIGLSGLAQATPAFADCAAGMGYTARWAAEWGDSLPIYPRANIREAAGNTLGGCDIRAVSFLTPVAQRDVAAFYNSSARKAGLETRLARAGDTLILEATGPALAGKIYVVSTPYGTTRVDMVIQRTG